MNRKEPYREPTSDIVECEDCGTKFDLEKQRYYSKRCPACENQHDKIDWTVEEYECDDCGARFTPFEDDYYCHNCDENKSEDNVTRIKR